MKAAEESIVNVEKSPFGAEVIEYLVTYVDIYMY